MTGTRTLCALLIVFAAPAGAADAGRGKEVYKTCAACHTEKPDALGPSLKGILGRRSAALEDYRYSSAMLRADLVWDEANLRAYLANPQAKVAGNRMAFSGLDNGTDIDDLVEYLATLR
jgi:cytochrome c